MYARSICIWYVLNLNYYYYKYRACPSRLRFSCRYVKYKIVWDTILEIVAIVHNYIEMEMKLKQEAGFSSVCRFWKWCCSASFRIAAAFSSNNYWSPSIVRGNCDARPNFVLLDADVLFVYHIVQVEQRFKANGNGAWSQYVCEQKCHRKQDSVSNC